MIGHVRAKRFAVGQIDHKADVVWHGPTKAHAPRLVPQVGENFATRIAGRVSYRCHYRHPAMNNLTFCIIWQASQLFKGRLRFCQHCSHNAYPVGA